MPRVARGANDELREGLLEDPDDEATERGGALGSVCPQRAPEGALGGRWCARRLDLNNSMGLLVSSGAHHQADVTPDLNFLVNAV